MRWEWPKWGGRLAGDPLPLPDAGRGRGHAPNKMPLPVAERGHMLCVLCVTAMG